MSLEELLARWADKQAYLYVHRYRTFKPIPNEQTVGQFLATFDANTTHFEADDDEYVRFGPPWVINIYVEVENLGTCHFQVKGL